ncbi:hypothetical protein SPRG_19119 [Saprolegnia parasitica CBS 223.65]|uniref:Uncharacterized protein n=1 Tax=Saprolegnia parasitica (strain CBS 223.65) TaxID=695850 RepID=A0A067CUX9_SAPPC|nr:hypothetical protein SPRG_19119 [Saprolegnia parasitica CBS 223.65]KDO34303.1 hypothetical protein SPRG_19119 [Saprolegnia parasitica CBS 223.65]|eukprot:XP_012195312.1 hypothetical protein SPRG_19119 [Saprolegnia parasitica CBS 223.65]
MAAQGSGSSVFDGVLIVLYIFLGIFCFLLLLGLYFCYKNARADAELDELQGYHEVEDPPCLNATRDTVCSRGQGIRCDKIDTKVALQGITSTAPALSSQTSFFSTTTSCAAVTPAPVAHTTTL